MPGETFGWLTRIKDVEREHTAMRLATDHLLTGLTDGTKHLERDLKRVDVTRASKRLEGTYIVRLFSEFEEALKEFLTTCGKPVPRTAERLINRVASRTRFSGTILANAHAVRDYRNRLVHSRDEVDDPMQIRTATKYLCTFLSQLPSNW